MKYMDTLNKNVVFCLLARDCADNLSRNISFIEGYRQFFNKTSVVIVENDSKDNTKAVLDKWRKTSDGIIIKQVDSSGFDKLQRIERMCVCRNVYMNELKKIDFDIDYMILLDSDVELRKLDLAKIITSAPSDWSALFANGKYYYKICGIKYPVTYYDLYAYIPHKTEDIELNNIQIMNNGKNIDKLIRRNKYLLCDSAFGGMAIYRYDCIKNVLYEAVPNTKSVIFKHLIDHLRINQACLREGNLYICRDMKLYYEKLSIKNLFNTYIRLLFGYETLMKLLNFYQSKIKHRNINNIYY